MVKVTRLLIKAIELDMGAVIAVSLLCFLQFAADSVGGGDCHFVVVLQFAADSVGESDCRFIVPSSVVCRGFSL